MHIQRSIRALWMLLGITISTLALAADSLSQASVSGRASSKANPIHQSTLLSSDGGTGSFFGAPVAVDGDTLAATAPGSEEVYVFVKPPSGWEDATETAILRPSVGGLIGFGTSVAVSADVIVVGAPEGGSDNQGVVFVYVKPPSGWTDMTETAQLTASDGEAFDYLGDAVGMSNNTIVATADGGFAEHAYVYAEPPTGWTNMTETAELGNPNATGFGRSVAISVDNVVVGADGCCIQGEPTRGQADVFKKPRNGWVTTFKPSALLTGSNETKNDNFGEVVVYRNNTIVVGSDHKNGAAYVFVEPPGGWQSAKENAVLTSSDSLSADFFGERVATNGNLVAVGAYGYDHDNLGWRGAVYIYKKPTSGWATTSSANTTLFPSPDQTQCELGRGLYMTGATLAMGCPGAVVNNHVNQGSVLVVSK